MSKTFTLDRSVWEAAEKQLSELIDKDATATAEADRAAAALADARGRLSRGDDSVSGVELAGLVAADERAGLLAKAATDALARHRRSMPVEPTAALAVAPVLERLTGLPTQVVANFPTGDALSENLPTLYVSQAAAGKRDWTGMVECDRIELLLVRGAIHRELDAKAINDGIAKTAGVAGVVYEYGNSVREMSPGVFTQSVPMMGIKAYPEKMVIPTVPAHKVRDVLPLVAAHVRKNAGNSPPAPLQIKMAGGVTYGSRIPEGGETVTVKHMGTEYVEKVAKDGTRTVTVTGTIAARIGVEVPGVGEHASRIVALLPGTLASLVGQPVGGVGRIVAAECVGPDRQQAYGMKVRITLESHKA